MKPIKILILSFYYHPDIGPCPIRTKSLVDSLVNSKIKLEIDIYTTMPNRYDSYDSSAQEKYEVIQNVKIRRFIIPSHSSRIIDQSISFLSYGIKVLISSRKENWDIIFATSSRLMTASLGAFLAKIKHSKLYLDIRDIFSETLSDTFSKSIYRLAVNPIRALERRVIRSADLVNINSEGFMSFVKNINSSTKITKHTNGIDNDFICFNFSKKSFNKIPIVLYAGNIGEGQGLHRILPDVARKIKTKVIFRVIGDGGLRKILEKRINDETDIRVEIINPMPRSKLMDEYQKADILFLHLNDYQVFKNVLPSKIFEYSATGKPILAGVSGYAKNFLNDNINGSEVFHPCDSSGMIRALEVLLAGKNSYNRDKFIKQYLRKNIMRSMANDLLALYRL